MVEVAIGSAAAISKVAISNGHCNFFTTLFTKNHFRALTFKIQCPLDIATLDIAAALPIATSNPMELEALALHK